MSKSYKCGICGKEFASGNDLSKHDPRGKDCMPLDEAYDKAFAKAKEPSKADQDASMLFDVALTVAILLDAHDKGLSTQHAIELLKDWRKHFDDVMTERNLGRSVK